MPFVLLPANVGVDPQQHCHFAPHHRFSVAHDTSPRLVLFFFAQVLVVSLVVAASGNTAAFLPLHVPQNSPDSSPLSAQYLPLNSTTPAEWATAQLPFAAADFARSAVVDDRLQVVTYDLLDPGYGEPQYLLVGGD